MRISQPVDDEVCVDLLWSALNDILVFTLIYFAYLSFRMTPAISASISIWDGVGSDSEKIF